VSFYQNYNLLRLAFKYPAITLKKIQNRFQKKVSLQFPALLNFFLYPGCNLKCTICYQYTVRGNYRLPVDHVRKICAETFPTAKKVILTTSGEPLISNFEEILEECRKYNVLVDMYTNGFFFSREKYDLAKDLFDVVHVSFDSHVKGVYENIRVNSDFDRVVNNIQEVLELRKKEGKGFLLGFCSVLMKSNIEHLPDYVRFVHEMGADGIVIQRLYFTNKKLKEEDIFLNLTQEERDGPIREAQRIARELKFNLMLGDVGYENVFDGPIRNKRPPLMERPICWFVAQQIGFTPTGEVYPCCLPTTMVMGDTFHQSAREIWNSKPYQKLRSQLYSGKLNFYCSHCRLLNPNCKDDGTLALFRRNLALNWLYFKGRMKARFRKLLSRNDGASH